MRILIEFIVHFVVCAPTNDKQTNILYYVYNYKVKLIHFVVFGYFVVVLFFV